MNDGIVFGMPEEDYHAVNRLSPSGIKRLRISAATFWADSWLNPNPKVLTEEQQRRTELAKVLGRAYHCARLEPDAFHERYLPMLDKADFEGVEGFVAGGTAYGEALAALGEAKKKAGESVAEQAHRLAAAGYEGTIWDVALADWLEDKGERIAIPALNWAEILQDMNRISAVPEIHALLSGGVPEVSIFWTCPETGLPMKTRLDYLRPDGWADFKTFANPNGKHVQQAITDSFRFSRYHVQAAVQRQAVEMIRAGKLSVISEDGDVEPFLRANELVAAIMDSEHELTCEYIWQEKGGVPNLWARKLRFFQPDGMAAKLAELEADGASADHMERARNMAEISKGSPPAPTAWHGRAKREVAAAKRDFMTYSQVYKPGEPWMPFSPVGEMTDDDFSKFWLEEID